MIKSILASSTLALALLSINFAPSLKADEWDKRTVVTVEGGSVQVQGHVLEPGKYIFKLADSEADRLIVEIFNADETQLKTVILANAAYRLDSTGDTRFTFAETPAEQPAAISTWFYPGDNYGFQFAVR